MMPSRAVGHILVKRTTQMNLRKDKRTGQQCIFSVKKIPSFFVFLFALMSKKLIKRAQDVSYRIAVNVGFTVGVVLNVAFCHQGILRFRF